MLDYIRFCISVFPSVCQHNYKLQNATILPLILYGCNTCSPVLTGQADSVPKQGAEEDIWAPRGRKKKSVFTLQPL